MISIKTIESLKIKNISALMIKISQLANFKKGAKSLILKRVIEAEIKHLAMRINLI